MAIFAPLNIITGYSFLQSGLTMEKVATGIKSNDYFGLGIADNGVMYGVPEFVKISEELKKPYLCGLRIKVNDFSCCLYSLSETGYKNLIIINNEFQKEKLTFEVLKNHCTDLACILETKYDKFLTLSTTLNESDRVEINKVASLFETFYLGVEVTSKDDVAYANKIRLFANEYSYDCIAFPRIKYLKKDDAIVLNIVTAIANDATLEEQSAIGQEYFMSEENYKKIYTQKELNATIELIKKSSFNFHQKRGVMLKYDENPDDLLSKKCHQKLEELDINDESHNERLDKELSIIKEMGYPDYFLLVEDYVNYAKNHDILVGAGRGSSAGSLVAYLLNITEVDPLKYDLLFERFLNPHRKTMPDIDVDFMDIRRDDVVQYMRDKFGQERVANIVAFQTIQAKQSIRDVGKVYKFPPNHIDLLCKRLTNNKLNLRESYKQLKEFRSIVDSDKFYLQIVTLASKIEGLPRQSGLHAAGVILNNDPLDSTIPLTFDFSGNYISQYEMDYLEDQGLLKMDFLGLRNLTTVYYCLQLIKQNHQKDIKFTEIPYDDSKAIELLASGCTMGIFQLESSGMKRAIKILQPTCFADIVALLALFRPGPMDSITSYSRRKQGLEKINYYSDSLKSVLASTYGIIVYQEQINQIAQVMAGFSMADADLFRRAVSKKKADELSSLKDSFINGAIKNNYSEAVAKEIFNSILKFADYGLNKSHSAVYSILACRMAYLKKYYPLEFYSAILETSSSTSDTKFNSYVSEMKKLGYTMLPPNINESTKTFAIQDKSLLFPLSGIKGISDLNANNIIEERKNNGKFKDLFNFIIRMKQYNITDNQITNLIDAGAMDVFCNSRESLRVSIRSGNQYAKMITNDDGQLMLDGIEGFEYPKLIEQTDDPIENLNKEFEAIGIMLSNNPLHYKQDLLKENNVVEINDLEPNYIVKICGIIRDIKTITTKKNQTMAFLKVFDENGEIEVTVFSDAYLKSVNFIRKNKIVLITGKYQEREEDSSFIADNIKLLEEDVLDA